MFELAAVMSKIEAGLLRATRQTFDLGALLLDVERMFRLQAMSKGLEFRVRAAADVPLGIATDQAKLRQVLINLVGNAIKFTQHGSVVVEVSSTFWFELEVDVVSDPQRGTRPIAPLRPHAALTAGVEILIVDDHDLHRRSLVELLRPLGLPVLEATNGEEALVQFERHRPKLVLMDMRMPIMDGYEAVRRIRQSAGSDEVRIVALTASMFSDDHPEIRGCGADDVLRKPFRQDALFGIIEAQLALLPQPARA